MFVWDGAGATGGAQIGIVVDGGVAGVIGGRPGCGTGSWSCSGPMAPPGGWLGSGEDVAGGCAHALEPR